MYSETWGEISEMCIARSAARSEARCVGGREVGEISVGEAVGDYLGDESLEHVAHLDLLLTENLTLPGFLQSMLNCGEHVELSYARFLPAPVPVCALVALITTLTVGGRQIVLHL